MLFPTIDFALFFLVVFGVGWSLSGKPVLWKLAMLGFSYFFYAWWDPRFVLLLVAETLIAHVGSRRIHATHDEAVAKRWTWVTVGGLLGILGYFKYAGFFAVNLDNL